MINIEPLFNPADLEKQINDDLQKWFNELGEKLMKSGKAMVDSAIRKAKTGAFTGGGFGNITYDLRSSMGCGLVVNGVVTQTYFPFGRTSEGKQHGMQLLKSVATEVTEEIALVMVAGEKYAVFVEQKGYDVITMSFATFDPYFIKEVKNA